MTEPRMCAMNQEELISLQWRHNECNGVSNHGRLDCLLNRLSRRKSKKTSKLSVTGLFEGNSPVTGEFPSQRASDEENVSIWCHRSCRWTSHDWLHHWPACIMLHSIAKCIIYVINSSHKWLKIDHAANVHGMGSWTYGDLNKHGVGQQMTFKIALFSKRK